MEQASTDRRTSSLTSSRVKSYV